MPLYCDQCKRRWALEAGANKWDRYILNVKRECNWEHVPAAPGYNHNLKGVKDLMAKVPLNFCSLNCMKIFINNPENESQLIIRQEISES